jgi:hypothetical protein
VTDETTEPAPTASELDARVNRIEQSLTQVLDLLKGKGPAHAEAQQATETRLGASSVAADAGQEAIDELARRDAQAKQDELDARFGRHEEALAKLTEAKPQSPRRKVEERMGYHG